MAHENPHENAPSPDQPKFPPAPLPTIIPGGSVSLLAGAPGVGKTTLIASLMRWFRDSSPIFGHTPGKTSSQAILVADRSWTQSSRLWFEKAGYADIPSYSLLDDRSFKKAKLRRKQDRISVLQECLGKLGLTFGSLVVIDPLSLFLGGDLNNYDACLVACCEIREICQDRGITIIGTAHASKQKADKKERYLRLQDRILGSTALFGYTDTQMYLASPDEISQDYYAFLWNPHHAPAETFRLRRDETGLFAPFSGEDEGKPVPKEKQPVVLDSNASMLMELIPDLPEYVTFGQLVDLAASSHQFSRATVHRMLQQLAADGLVKQQHHGQWSKPTPS